MKTQKLIENLKERKLNAMQIGEILEVLQRELYFEICDVDNANKTSMFFKKIKEQLETMKMHIDDVSAMRG